MIGNITIGDTGLYYSGSSNTDGFGLWKSGTHNHNNSYIIFHAGGTNSHIENAGFRVYQNGNMYSTKGQIGGWTIGTHKLSGGSMDINDDGSLSGPHWSISSSGYATFSDIKITNEHSHYSDGTTKLLDFGNFNVRKNGNMYASSGRIGNWDISNGAIKNNDHNNVYLGSDGSVRFGDNTHYFSLGYGTDHPVVSALNVDGSINMGSNRTAIDRGENYIGGTAFRFNDNIQSAGAVLSKTGFYVDTHPGVTNDDAFYVCTGINQSGGTYTSVWRQFRFRGGILTYLSGATNGIQW